MTHPWPQQATPVVIELSPLPLFQPPQGDSYSAGAPCVHCHVKSAQGWSFHNGRYQAARRPDMSHEPTSDKFWWPTPTQTRSLTPTSSYTSPHSTNRPAEMNTCPLFLNYLPTLTSHIICFADVSRPMHTKQTKINVPKISSHLHMCTQTPTQK